MVPAVESMILENLASWEEQGTVVGNEATEKLIADMSSYIALGVKSIHSTPEGRLAVKNMFEIIDGIGKIPINLPGTGYNKACKVGMSKLELHGGPVDVFSFVTLGSTLYLAYFSCDTNYASLFPACKL
ncbi:unnamed protein product [Calypogeia fissa]